MDEYHPAITHGMVLQAAGHIPADSPVGCVRKWGSLRYDCIFCGSEQCCVFLLHAGAFCGYDSHWTAWVKKVSAGSGGALSGRICTGRYLTIPENAGSFWRNTHLAGRRDKCSDIADSGRISQKPKKESQSFKGDHAVLRCQENSGACLV